MSAGLIAIVVSFSLVLAILISFHRPSKTRSSKSYSSRGSYSSSNSTIFSSSDYSSSYDSPSSFDGGSCDGGGGGCD